MARAELPQAEVRLNGGTTHTGNAEIEDGSLLVKPADGDPIRIGIGEIAQISLKHEEETTPPLRSRSRSRHSRSPGIFAISASWSFRENYPIGDTFVLRTSPRRGNEDFSAFHMAYMPVEGNVEIVARVTKIENPDEDSYGGIIIADGTDPNAHKALLSVKSHGEQRVDFRRWGYKGGSSTGKEDPAIKLPYWLKLQREEKVVRAYHSTDGRRWEFLKESKGKMRDETVYVGLAARAEKFDRLSEVRIDNVRINGLGEKASAPPLPQIVLTAGSTIASEIESADGAAFKLRGRWADQLLTNPRVARIEFFHPLRRTSPPLVR